MKKIFKKVWNDPVRSSFIATGFFALLSLIYSFIIPFTKNIDFQSAFLSFWTSKIQLWIILLFLIGLLFIIKIIKTNKQYVYKAGEVELDKILYLKIREEILPQNQTIDFLRHNNFAGFSFDRKILIDTDNFEREKDNPNFHFFHPKLEIIKNELMGYIGQLNCLVATQTFPTPQGRQSVPSEWESEQPERFNKAVDDIHSINDRICSKYDELIINGRDILKV